MSEILNRASQKTGKVKKISEKEWKHVIVISVVDPDLEVSEPPELWIRIQAIL